MRTLSFTARHRAARWSQAHCRRCTRSSGRGFVRRIGISTPLKPPTEIIRYRTDEVAGRLLTEMILPVSQFFAYLEVGEAGGYNFRYARFFALDPVPAPAHGRSAAVDAQGQRAQRDFSGVPRSVPAPRKQEKAAP